MIRNTGSCKLTPDFCKMLKSKAKKFGLNINNPAQFKELKKLLTLNQN